MTEKSKIAILSTVKNFPLYRKSSGLFPAGIKKYVIDGRNKMYGIDSICFMMKKFKNTNIEWLIMADEDVIFVNPDAVFPIIDEMKRKNLMFSGVREGGEISHRIFNPYAINTFFSILNFKALQLIWDEKEMLSNQYALKDEFEDDLSQLKYPFDTTSLFEPYHCFYLWMRRKGGQPLYLHSESILDDDIANIVLDINDKPMLYHSWYSRDYGVVEKHTKRIDKLFGNLIQENKIYEEPTIFKDHTFALIKLLERVKCKFVSLLAK